MESHSLKDLREYEKARTERLLEEFDARYPTEAACMDELFRCGVEEGIFQCCQCGSRKLSRGTGRTCICDVCKSVKWFTAGTLFHRIRRARPWLLAVWLMENGVTPNSLSFHVPARVSQSTAFNILRKVRAVLANKMADDAPTANSSVFYKVMSKRSRETPAREHPREEERDFAERSAADADEPLSDSNSNTDADTSSQDSAHDNTNVYPNTHSEIGTPISPLEKQKKRVYEALSDKPIGIDDLSKCTGLSISELLGALTMLQMDGLLNSLPGEQFIRSSPVVIAQTADGESTVSKANIKLLVRFVRSKFHGISRKYLQNYIAGYWCRISRRRWHSGSLLSACLRSHPIFYQDLLAYVSPSAIKILPIRRAPIRNLQRA